MLSASILLTVVSELMFTFYISVYDISNLIGHYFKLGSFWLIYKAIIEIGLQRPYALLFREITASERRHQELTSKLPTGICEIDPSLRITYINPAGLKIIGYKEQDVKRGLHLDMLLENADREKTQNRINDLLKGLSIGSSEYQLQRKDGTKADVIINSCPILRDGELTSVQASLTDVTEVNRLQRQVQQIRKREALAILAGGMAHEINNALTGVVGRIELIRLKVAKQQVTDTDFTDVLDGCDRIADLIRQLQAYSRGGRYRSEPIDMIDFTQKRLVELQKRLDPKIRLSCHHSSSIPKIAADPMQLQMVIEEIVRNAVEATLEDGQIEIDIRAREIDADQAARRPGFKPGQYVRLKVRDTGKGMDAETLQHIFEPFYTRKFPGRGLGMAAVYGIVKNHGGWIGVDSEPDCGTTVQIYFPINNFR